MRFQKEISIYSKDAILKRFQANETSFSVLKGKIEALISESEILELQNNKVTMYSKLADVKFTVDGLSQDYTDISSKYDAVSGQYTDLDAKVAEYKQGVDGLSQTLTQVKSNLEDNYSTTTAMNAAIKAQIDGFSSTVSSTYAKSLDVTEKLTAADSTAKGYADAAKQAAIDTAKKSTDDLLKSYATVEKAQSMINQKAESIESTVSSTYAKKDSVTQLEEWKKEASQKITDSAIISTVTNSGEWKNVTKFIQDTDGWQMNWDSLIDASDADSDTYKQYISFKNGDILLGHSTSESKLKITNDSIQFKGTSDTEVIPDSDASAWITGKTFHIDTGEIQSSLKFGDVYLTPTSKGVNFSHYENGLIPFLSLSGNTLHMGDGTSGGILDISRNHIKLGFTTLDEAIGPTSAFEVRAGAKINPCMIFGQNSAENPGSYSVAIGTSHNVSGSNSMAIGSGCSITGISSVVIGSNLQSNHYDQLVVGQYNQPGDYAFIVGNGTASARSNTFTVSKSGDVNAAGTIAVGGNADVSGTANVTGALHTKDSEYFDTNNTSIYGTCTDGNNSEMLRLNASNELLVGYGQYDKGTAATRIYGGNKIAFYLKNPSTAWVPYYTKGDSVSVKIYRAGYITTGGKELMFFIPLSRPIVGASAVAVSSVDGLTVRQNGDYCFSKVISSSPIKPSSYSANIVGGGCGINIKATFTDTTNVKNNDSCGVYASIKITFS